MTRPTSVCIWAVIFDTSTLSASFSSSCAVIRLRAQDAQQRQEFEMILDTYKSALGMIADLPLGQAAIERAGLKRTEASTVLAAG